MKPAPSLVTAADRMRWNKARIARQQEEARQRRIEREQPTLEGLADQVLCGSCCGLGCGDCGNEGAVDRDQECPRCYGVGSVADRRLMIHACRDCKGTGRVPEERR